MDFIRKTGVLGVKQPLFAPMRSTFGGGSSRGFNPGGGGTDFDYVFVSSTFGNGGQTGSSAASNSTYLSNITGSTIPSDKISVSGGFITWTPPGAATYRITVVGAAGLKPNGVVAGNGASMRGDFSLDNTTQLKMIIGQKGTPAYGGAGGGMSVVAFTDNTLLIVAGGGGGAAYDGSQVASGGTVNAITSISGAGIGNASGAGETYSASGGCGGAGGGGAAYNVNAANNQHQGAKSFTSGSAEGGVTQSSSSGNTCVAVAYGGFGGGGGGGNTGPGGGGYKGGDGNNYAGSQYGAGNGGSSYNNGSNQVNSANHGGTGSITIEVV